MNRRHVEQKISLFARRPVATFLVTCSYSVFKQLEPGVELRCYVDPAITLLIDQRYCSSLNNITVLSD